MGTALITLYQQFECVKDLANTKQLGVFLGEHGIWNKGHHVRSERPQKIHRPIFGILFLLAIYSFLTTQFLSKLL